MNDTALAVALIRKSCNQNLRWLARFNHAKKQLGFVIGQRLEGESFRETTIREVAWELSLDRKRDFLVSNMAQMNLEFIDQMPGYFDKERVRVSFYNVEIYRKEIMKQLDAGSENYWVTSEEICSGVTKCGRKLDPLFTYLVKRSSVIQSWESSSGR